MDFDYGYETSNITGEKYYLNDGDVIESIIFLNGSVG